VGLAQFRGIIGSSSPRKRGFIKEHSVKLLVWYEQHETAYSAITREKQIKKWNRAWKIEVIETKNPYWSDLYSEITS
jgi:putative endonuclease